MRVEGIESEDELKKAQSAAQAQGNSVTNYSEWEEILSKFEEYGVESTGSYEGDVAKMQEIEQTVQEYIDEIETQQVIEQNNANNREDTKVQKASETDRNQELKATVANATSSQIMADYMKYYHLLMW